MRKKILDERKPPTNRPSDELDVASLATVWVTSEEPAHPIENAFDTTRGPGATRWLAAKTGEQTIILEFDAPQTLRHVRVEIEEQSVSRTQDLVLAVSTDGGQTYRELVRQEYNFSPPTTTFEREDWTVTANRVSHLRLVIRPDKGNASSGLATLTALGLS